MSVSAVSAPSSSKVLVLYVSRKTRLEQRVNETFRHSLEVWKFEFAHLTVGPSHIDPQAAREARSRRLYHVLPSLTGPYTVGHASFVLERPKAPHILGDDKIGIELYAPTAKGKGSKLLMRFLDDPAFLKKTLHSEQLQTLHTHSLDQIHPVTKARIVVFSHGLGTDPILYRPMLEELASHGYLVVSLNHPSSSGSARFSNVTLDMKALEELDRTNPEEGARIIEGLAATQAENIRYVVEQIRHGALGKIPRDIGLADQIILAGHSLGGAASIITSRADPQIGGCIHIDGMLKGNNKTVGLEKPLLMIFSDVFKDQDKASKSEREAFQKWKTAEYDPMVRDWKALYDNSKHPVAGKIDGTGHMDFCVYPILTWLLGEKSLSGALKAHHIATREMLRFMNLLF